jgi:hypothetical protein
MVVLLLLLLLLLLAMDWKCINKLFIDIRITATSLAEDV